MSERSPDTLYAPELYIGDRRAVSVLAAAKAAALIRASPGNFKLGTATGSSPRDFYAAIRELRARGAIPIDPNNLVFVGLDEYLGKSLYQDEMRRELWDPFGIPPENAIMPFADTENPYEGDACLRFEKRRQELGRLHLQVLGIGPNGHIAFNEPPASRTSRTRVARISAATVEANKIHFGGNAALVPLLAVTQGVETIVEGAEEHFVFSFGEAKADATAVALGAERFEEQCPATALIYAPKVRWFMDGAAASKVPPHILRHARRVA